MDLQIPTLHKPGRHDFNTDPAALRQWVAELPLANNDRTAELLHGALTAMNSLQLPGYERFDDLELLADPVRGVVDALRKRYIGKRFPLDEKSRENVRLSTSLCIEMANGYKITAIELDRKRKRGTPLEQALLHAIRHLGETLFGYYATYAPYPAGIWRDLHGLFELAVRHKLADGRGSGKLAPIEGTGSIADSYKQNLLMSLACPYRMRQGDIRSVYTLLADWARHCRLHRGDDSGASGYFACHLDSDEPPRYLHNSQRDTLDSRWLIIDTRELEAPVRATIARRQESATRLSILPDEAVLQRLMLSWGMMPRRQFPRRDIKSRVRMVIGLAGIHRSLESPAAAQSADNAEADAMVEDTEYLRDPTFERITTIDTTPVDTFDPKNPFRGSYSPGSRKADKSVRIESWKMHDMSAGGYCLLWDSTETSSAHVGELVAIIEGDNTDSDWQLGVIRWMRFTPTEGLMLGVQMLSPGARPVWASLCKDEPGVEDRMQGILLPGVAAIQQPDTLLLPSLPFHAGCLSTLDDAGSERRVRLTGQIEDTGSFAQFLYAEPVAG